VWDVWCKTYPTRFSNALPIILAKLKLFLFYIHFTLGAQGESAHVLVNADVHKDRISGFDRLNHRLNPRLDHASRQA
jgi:hypothetical protein